MPVHSSGRGRAENPRNIRVERQLLANPHRAGKRLEPPLADRHSARRGTYRVIYRIDDHRQTVTVVAVAPGVTPIVHAELRMLICAHVRLRSCDDPFVIGRKRLRIRHDNLPATVLGAETATERVRDASVRGVDPVDGIRTALPSVQPLGVSQRPGCALRADNRVDFLGHLVDGSGQVGIGLEFLLLGDEIMIGLLLLERGLPVLADHDEGREKDRLE